MNKITAPEGYWYFNGEMFAREIVSYGEIKGWSLVTDDFRTNFEEKRQEEPIESPTN